MTAPNMHLRIFLFPTIAIALLLNACAHAPGPQDIPPGASFTANILADNTKLFVYTVGRGGKGGAHSSDGGDSTSSDDGGERSGARGRGSHGGGMARSGKSPADMQKGVTAMLAQNHYCREGYVVLEQYQAREGYVVRGECRDSADTMDRSKFTH